MILPRFRQLVILRISRTKKLGTFDTVRHGRLMRFGLGIALLGGSYYNYNEWHASTYWFSEYDAELGIPLGEYKKLDNGAYTREFYKGIVIVNPTENNVIINLDGKYMDNSTREMSFTFIVETNDAKILTK